MKLIFIRHGDPIYTTDTLTEKGEREALLLGKSLVGKTMDSVYASPLGRALRTCQVCSEIAGFSYEVLPWLEEFPTRIYHPTRHKKSVIWDLPPSYYMTHPLLSDRERWMEDVIFDCSNVKEKYQRVREGLAQLLLKHGYRMENNRIFAERSNTDTVVLFCHFGVMSVMMSILSACTPYVFFQNFCSLTTSVSTFVTEERIPGEVSFRCISYSDVSHLAAGSEEPSTAGRFRETYFSPGRE